MDFRNLRTCGTCHIVIFMLKTLGMTQCTVNPCLFYEHEENDDVSSIIPNMVVIQVDDSLGIVSDTFLEKEEKVNDQIECKARKIISVGERERFYGCHFQQKKLMDRLSWTGRKTLLVLLYPTIKNYFERKSTKNQYLGSFCRPDLVGCSQIM